MRILDPVKRREIIFEFICVVETARICGATLNEACDWAESLYYAKGYWQEPTTENTTPRLQWREWSLIRERVLARDNYICRYCGDDKDLCVDHVVPLSRGGANEEDNLACACRPCNASKKDKLLAEWTGRRQ